MYKILEKKLLAPNIYLMDVHVPRIAKSAKPGQFVIVRVDEKSERIPLTICDYDADKETVTIVFQVVGNSTKKMESLEIGDYFEGFAGPLGQPSELVYEKEEDLRKKNILYIAGGVGAAPVYPQVKWLNSIGVKTDVIIGAKTKDLIILEEEMKKEAGNLYIATDDGSYGYKGLVTDLFKDLVENKNKKYDLVVTIGPMIMMKFVTKATKEYCRVTVGGETKFTCVDGPEFDGHLVDFDEALRRQGMYKTEEGKALLEKQEREEGHVCHVGLGGDH